MILMVLGVFFINLSNVFAKLLYQSNEIVTVIEVQVTSRFIQMIPNFLVIMYFKIDMRVAFEKEVFKKLMFRSVFGYTTWTAMYFSVKYLPLGLIQTVQNLVPFLTLILSYILLKETLKRLEILNMIVCFVGVLIVVGYSSKAGPSSAAGGAFFTASLIAIFYAAGMLAVVNVLIRSLKAVHWAIMALFQAVTGFCFSAALWLAYRFVAGEVEYGFGLADFALMTGMGCGIAAGQILWIKALQLDKAGRCASITMLNIVFAYAFDILIFSY